MRISDWSSDVCSSDLPGQTARASHYRLRFLRKDLILRQPFLLMAGLSLLGYASTAFAGDYRYAHKAGVSASMIESDESECFEAAKLAMHKPSAPNPYNTATQSTAARSEEHTSELQSLMRISYAVFCLKKKKHKNRQINNIKVTSTNKQYRHIGQSHSELHA